MKKQINFAVVSDTGGQEMIVNFYPPLIVDDSGASKIKGSLSAALVKITGDEHALAELDEHALGLLEDRDDDFYQYDHRTVFGSKLTARFDKVGVRLIVENGSMVFISAGAQDAMIAIKPAPQEQK